MARHTLDVNAERLTLEMRMKKTHNLSASQLRVLRLEMEQELAWLLRSLAGKSSIPSGSSNDSSTPPSERDEMEEVLRDRAQSRLAAIVAALKRLDTGTYGECVSCRRPIPYGRLAVMPEATRCIACGGHGAPMLAHTALGVS
jgi:RNA polymerase-binding transcription factor DksA